VGCGGVGGLVGGGGLCVGGGGGGGWGGGGGGGGWGGGGGGWGGGCWFGVCWGCWWFTLLGDEEKRLNRIRKGTVVANTPSTTGLPYRVKTKWGRCLRTHSSDHRGWRSKKKTLKHPLSKFLVLGLLVLVGLGGGGKKKNGSKNFTCEMSCRGSRKV